MYPILFYILATVAVVAALALITRTNPLMSAVSLVVCLLSISGLFALLSAPILAVMWVLIMAGSVTMLFTYAIFMVDPNPNAGRRRIIHFGRILGAISAAYLAIVVAIAIMRPPFVDAPLTGEAFESASTLGRMIFSGYMVPFELAGILLFVAAVAAVIMLRRKI